MVFYLYPNHGQKRLQVRDQTAHLPLGRDLEGRDVGVDGGALGQGLDLDGEVAIIVLDDLIKYQYHNDEHGTSGFFLF